MSTLTALRLRAHLLVKTSFLQLCGFALLAALCQTAEAHVGLDSPNGGETLIGGSEFNIEWHVEIQHNTLDWDLWYSTESNEGPWEEIAVDLEAGNTNDGAPHSFMWSLPNLDMPNAWVRVRQDNAGQDYYDVSDDSFSIAAMLGGGDFTGDGTVDATDLANWEQGFGTMTTAIASNGDANLDGDVDGADFLAWQVDYSEANVTLTVQSIPEPTATVLLIMGLIFMLWQRR